MIMINVRGIAKTFPDCVSKHIKTLWKETKFGIRIHYNSALWILCKNFDLKSDDKQKHLLALQQRGLTTEHFENQDIDKMLCFTFGHKIWRKLNITT